MKITNVLSRWRALPHWQRRSIVISVGVALVCLGLLYCCSPQRLVTRIDQPMTLVQAQHIRGLNGFPFPSLARNIYYAGYADWIHHETLICFDAPQKDCEAALPQIIQWSIGSSKNSYPTVPLEREVQLPAPDRQFLPSVKWWDDVIIKHGSFAGEDSSNKPQVWIDGDLGRVYYYETD